MVGMFKKIARLTLWSDLAALLYPPQCHLCFGVAVSVDCRFLCDPCLMRIKNEARPVLRKPSHPFPFKTPLTDCDFDYAAWHYRGAMMMLLPQMKYANPHPSFARIFGTLAAQRMRPKLRKLISPQTILLPVPLHRVRHRERGFNQSELIAQTIAAEWKLEMWPHALVRTRYTKQQAHFVDHADRLRNVHEAFALQRNAQIKGRDLILVDDVITSGATVSACAQALKAAGANTIGAIALARGGGAL